ncbi:hypothetical protein PBY51_015024 [Eleginops maclovinus]|nr:hypothetical protein PBY51_015024 [Eleginops maclovinus]
MIRPRGKSCVRSTLLAFQLTAVMPQGEHFLTWAATSFAPSSQKLPEESRYSGNQSQVRGPLQAPEKLQRIPRTA